MIPKNCRRLAEVDFPIAEVSRHSAREKSIRHGHPSTLHLWWARRPLAACRAMLLALLLPDPEDPECPEEFKDGARAILRAPLPQPKGKGDADLRQALFRFIADFANWDASGEPIYLEAGRALVTAAHGDEPPVVVDPFAGGGSIPLEALRLGCEAFASDLNPVACLILKVLLEDIPRHGPKLAEELRRAGAEIKAAAEKDLAEFYPPDPDGARAIAYLWARTVRCESSGCGAEIPLVRSFWLSKKANHPRALRYRVERPKERPPEVVLEVFEPRADSEVPRGTVSRAKAACPACGIVLGPERVRAQLAAQRGGADVVFDERGRRTGGARLLVVVTQQPDQGRRYRLGTEADYRSAWLAARRLGDIIAGAAATDIYPLPTQSIPRTELRRISVPLYGCSTWVDMHTARQKLALLGISAWPNTATTVRRLLAAVVSRCVDYWSSGATWTPGGEFVTHTITRQAIPIVWDFAEAVPWTDSSGSYDGAVDWVARVCEIWPGGVNGGQVGLFDAAQTPLADQTASIWFTDPPYYDAFPYAHLSDFFYVWLKRLRELGCGPWFVAQLTAKEEECVVDRPHRLSPSIKGPAFFEAKVRACMTDGRRVVRDQGIGCVVFAHKSTEGWEALLSAIIQGGWTVTASWPVATERGSRLNARDTASLGTSVHLICRPRHVDARAGDWGDVQRELTSRLHQWMERLTEEGIRGADLVFACIGPALEVFSRYRQVELPDGEIVGLAADAEAQGEPAQRGFLSYIWEAVGRAALARVLGAGSPGAGNGGAGMLEEDARLTALFLWTIQSTSLAANGGGDVDDDDDEPDGAEDDEDDSKVRRKRGLVLIYDVVRRFAQPLGIHLDQWEGRIIETQKGVVRLLPVRERAVQLFGEEGATAVAERIETTAKGARGSAQGSLFPELASTPAGPSVKGRRKGRGIKAGGSGEDAETRREATTLDRVHAAMLFQAGGASNALRALLEAEVGRGPDFVRLANALSGLYPKDSEEKRLLDAMLLAAPR